MKLNVEALEKDILSLKGHIRDINTEIKSKEKNLSNNALSVLKQRKWEYHNRISTLNILIRREGIPNNSIQLDNLLNQIANIKKELFSIKTNDLLIVKARKLSLKNRLNEISLKSEELNYDQNKIIKEKVEQAIKSIDFYIDNLLKINTKIKLVNENKDKKNDIQKSKNINTIKPLKNLIKETKTYQDPIADQIIKTPWKAIEFQNGHILIKHNGRPVKVFCKRSTIHFKALQSGNDHILKNEILSVKYSHATKVYSIEENKIFNKIFNYLEIDLIISNYDIQNSDYFSRVVLNRLDNQSLLECFSPENHTPYLNHLCEIYTDLYKIAPVKEKRQNQSNGIILEEYAFLFPVHSQNSIFIIWESIEENRATYIFQCELTNYITALQKIFIYISSSLITNKRDRLRQSDVGYFNNSVVKYFLSINHDNFDSWKKRLNSAILVKK